MFAWHGVLPPYSIPGMPLAGQEMNGRFEPGMLVYGVPIGTGQYVESMKEVKTEEIVKEAMQACKVLAEENQSLWTTLRLSTQQKLDYWLMLLHPTQVQTAAAKIDSILWQMLEEVIGAHLPRLFRLFKSHISFRPNSHLNPAPAKDEFPIVVFV